MKLRIKQIAKTKKVTMGALADHLKVTPTQISNYVKGSNLIPLDKLYKTAELLECDVLELIEPSSNNFAHFYNKDGEWWGIRKQ